MTNACPSKPRLTSRQTRGTVHRAFHLQLKHLAGYLQHDFDMSPRGDVICSSRLMHIAASQSARGCRRGEISCRHGGCRLRLRLCPRHPGLPRPGPCPPCRRIFCWPASLCCLDLRRAGGARREGHEGHVSGWVGMGHGYICRLESGTSWALDFTSIISQVPCSSAHASCD